MVVPGTVRDTLYILDTMLNLDAGPKPEMIATDTASYSDIVFGLFRLLGYRVLPAHRRPIPPAVLAGHLARDARGRLRAAERDRPPPCRPEPDPGPLAGHAPGRRVPGH